nr:hypothetical protein [uncultured Rhodopila sp.]
MTRFGALAGSALAALCPILAEAQPLQGFYLGGALGPNIAGNMLSANQTTKMYTNVGPAAIVDLGWGFGNGLRAEIEGGYRSDAIGGISTRRGSGDLLPLANVSGTAGAYAAMANLAYDLPLQPLGIQPYIGAGLGYAWLNLAGTHGNGYGTIPATGNNTVTGPTSVTFGNAGGFAYQGFAGASLPIPGVPGLTASVEYRYFGPPASIRQSTAPC